jgi:hypothetical protein
MNKSIFTLILCCFASYTYCQDSTVTIKNNGYVGLGIPNPQHPIDIFDTTAYSGIRVQSNSSGLRTEVYGTGSNFYLNGMETLVGGGRAQNVGANIFVYSDAPANFGYTAFVDGDSLAYGANLTAASSSGLKPAYGISALALNGSENYGGYFKSTGPGAKNYGVYGSASGATTNWAGYFEGDGHFSDHVTIGQEDNEFGFPLLVRGNQNGLNGSLILSEVMGSMNVSTTAIQGISTPADGFGIGGSFTGGFRGVRGEAVALGGNQYEGVSGFVSGDGLGVKYGVIGASAATYGGYGVAGRSGGVASAFSYGVHGWAYGQGVNYGVYGKAENGTTNWAGYFEGNVHVSGSDNNGTSAAVRITSGGQHMLIDGNEIDAYGFDMYLNNNSDGNVIFTRGGGQIGINETAPDAMLHIKEYTNNERAITIEDSESISNCSMEMIGNELFFRYGGTQKAKIEFLNGAWVLLSDRRVKKDIIYFTKSFLDRINQLKPASYRYIDNDDTSMKSIGFIAQEAQEIFPEFIDKKEDQFMTLAYNVFSVLAIKSIQELSAQNATLENRITELEQQSKTLIEKVEQLVKK